MLVFNFSSKTLINCNHQALALFVLKSLSENSFPLDLIMISQSESDFYLRSNQDLIFQFQISERGRQPHHAPRGQPSTDFNNSDQIIVPKSLKCILTTSLPPLSTSPLLSPPQPNSAKQSPSKCCWVSAESFLLSQKYILFSATSFLISSLHYDYDAPRQAPTVLAVNQPNAMLSEPIPRV